MTDAQPARKFNRRSSTQFLLDEGQLVHLHEAKTKDEAILQVPVTTCVLALGSVVLGHTWLIFSALLLPGSAAFYYLAATVAALLCVLSGALLGLYCAKIIYTGPSAYLDELWTNPNDAARLVTGMMALMSIAFVLANFELYWMAAILFFIGVVGHLGVLIVFIWQLVQMGIEDVEVMNASFVVPTIGLSVAAGSGWAIGLGSWVSVFFWFGLLSAIYVYPLAIYRVFFKQPPVPEGLRYTDFVFLAPPCLLFIQFVAIGGHTWQIFPFTHLLFIWILCAIVVVAFSLPAILGLEFNTTAAAMTFPLDLVSKAFLMFWFAFLSDAGWLGWLVLGPAIVFFLLANFVVGYVTFKFAAICWDWYSSHPNSEADSAEEQGYQAQG